MTSQGETKCQVEQSSETGPRPGAEEAPQRRGWVTFAGSGVRFRSGEWSWRSLSGWGVALVVTLVAAPAMRGYWVLVDNGCGVPAPVAQGESHSVIALTTPGKPAAAGLEHGPLPEEPGQAAKPVASGPATEEPVAAVKDPVRDAVEAKPTEPAVGGEVPVEKAESLHRVVKPEPGLESMYHTGGKPEPIPLDFKFTIQVGSFLDRELAFRRASELRRKGYDAYILEAPGKKAPNQVWQSVRIGRFQERKMAQDALEIYKRKEIDTVAFVALHDAPAGSGEGMNKPGGGVESTLVAHKPARAIKEKPAASRPVVQPVAETVVEKPAGRAEPQSQGSEMDRELAAHLFQQSLAFRNNRDLTQEEAILRQTLQKDPGHGLARNRLARILVESNRGDEGLKVLQGAVHGRSPADLAGDDPNLAAFLAALYQRQEEHGQAVELYQKLLHRHPDRGIWRMGLAISLEKMGKTQQALDAYQESLSGADLSAKLRSFVQTRLERLK